MPLPDLTSFSIAHFSPALRKRVQHELRILVSYEITRSDQVLPTYSPGPARDDMVTDRLRTAQQDHEYGQKLLADLEKS
jgi:hypothetical protein